MQTEIKIHVQVTKKVKKLMTCQREQVKISNSNNYYNSKGKNNDNNNKKMEKNKHTMNVHVLMIIDTFVHFYILITSFETVPKRMKQTLIQTLKIYYNKIWLLMYSSIKITTFRQHGSVARLSRTN